MKLASRILLVPMALSALLSACGSDSEQETKFKVGLVTDLGSIEDKSFKENAYAGIEMAVKELDIEGTYLESRVPTDFAKNIQQYLDEDTKLIITVGYELGVDTAVAAKANPNATFAIVDYRYPDCGEGAVEGKDCGSASAMANVRSLNFQTDQAAFLAGYLAAGMTKTGKVATYGGTLVPTVTVFMKGFEAGVKHHNQQKATTVELLGWNTAANEGAFTGNFISTDDGRVFASNFMQKGADIILPVAGPVGLGSAAYCQETHSCWIIGVDADWFDTAPEYQSVLLTSVLKKIDVAVFNTIKDAKAGKFTGGNMTYSIADGGVDIAPFHELDAQVSADMKAEIKTIKQALIDGTLTVDGVLAQ